MFSTPCMFEHCKARNISAVEVKDKAKLQLETITVLV